MEIPLEQVDQVQVHLLQDVEQVVVLVDAILLVQVNVMDVLDVVLHVVVYV